MAANKMNNKADELYKIYEKFTEQITTQGWNGSFYGWKETVENDGKGKQWVMFELNEDFSLVLNDPGEDSEEKASLVYWFEDSSDEPAITVESLEQLLELLN